MSGPKLFALLGGLPVSVVDQLSAVRVDQLRNDLGGADTAAVCALPAARGFPQKGMLRARDADPSYEKVWHKMKRTARGAKPRAVSTFILSY